MPQTDAAENKEINIGDVYKLLQQSSQEIGNKIDGLEAKLKGIEEKYDTTITQLRQKVQIYENENRQLKSRLLNVDRKLRRRNLIFYGVSEEEGENIVLVLEGVLEEKLGVKLEKYDIINAFRMGKNARKPRPILVELLSEFKIREIIKKRKNLKGTNIFINEDLIPEDREEKKVLIEQLKLAKSKNKLAQLKGNKLIIEGEAYCYSDFVKQKDSVENIGYYTPPPQREVTSVPATPSEFEDLQTKLIEEVEKSDRNIVKIQEERKKRETESSQTEKEESNDKYHDTEEKKRKLQGSPNIITGAVPKVFKTRSGGRNQKN